MFQTSCFKTHWTQHSGRVAGMLVVICKPMIMFDLLIPNRYDDYDYGEINQLLDHSFKVYIKTVVCTPEKTTNRMYDSFWRQFKHSEKVFSAHDLLDFWRNAARQLEDQGLGHSFCDKL